MKEPRIIVAIDSPTEPYLPLFEKLDPSLCNIKIGYSLFMRHGPRIVSTAQNYGYNVFLDMKLHDIPNTVSDAISAAADMGVWMINLHASGGNKMMNAARETLEKCSHRPLLMAVTILTSLTDEDLLDLGLGCNVDEAVFTLTSNALTCGMDGIICSPKDITMINPLIRSIKKDFVITTPGIRLKTSPKDDQERITTPLDAINKGATYLVIGRPITTNKEPALVLRTITEQIEQNIE